MERKDPRKLWGITKNILHITMGLLYTFIGFYVIKKKWFMTELQDSISYALGGILILYGLFRIYRIYKTNEN